MRELIKMVVVLSVICGLSGLTLAGLRSATEKPIEEQVLTYVQAPALNRVLVGYDNDPLKERKDFTLPDGSTVTVFPARKNGKLYAVAFETQGKGFGGDIGVITGFNVDTDSLEGIGITTLKETPGVGSRVTEESFTRQFHGLPQNQANLRSAGGGVDAVAGATISSTGTVAAVQRALEIYNALKQDMITNFSAGS